VIVDVEVTPMGTCDEVAATQVTIEHTEQRLNVKPGQLIADRAYGAGKFLVWLFSSGIMPHIPLRDQSNPYDGFFSRSDFRFDNVRNEYTCPAGKVLWKTGKVCDGETLPYRGKLDCGPCPLKPQWCPKSEGDGIQKGEGWR
jgi:hypothetical protein